MAVGLGLNGAFVGGVLVVVDGVAHLPEVAAEFALLVAFDLEAGDRDSGGGKDGDDGHGDDEFDEGEAGLGVVGRLRPDVRNCPHVGHP